MTRTKTKRGSFGQKPLLSVDEVAIRLGITRSTAYRAIKNGTFPLPLIQLGGRLRIPTAAVNRLLNGEDPRGAVEPHKLSTNYGEES